MVKTLADMYNSEHRALPIVRHLDKNEKILEVLWKITCHIISNCVTTKSNVLILTPVKHDQRHHHCCRFREHVNCFKLSGDPCEDCTVAQLSSDVHVD